LKTVRSVGTAAESFGGMGFTLSAGSNLGTVTMTRVSGTMGAVTANGFTGINRKWVVTPTVQPASADRNVTMVWPSDDDNGKTLTAFQFWKSPDGIQPYDKFGAEQNVNVNPRTGTVTGIASFSTITGNDAIEPLPVKLLFFSGKNSAGNGYLYWATASEIDNKGFVIEKSTDGFHFQEIGFVPAIANSKGRNQYNFTDYELSVNSYYRLRQLDLDGKRYEYSHKVLIKTGKQAADVSLYPNPTAGNVDIRINGGNEFTDEMTVTLYSIEGRQIVQHGGVLSAINQDLNRTVAALAQGMYVVKITLADEIHTIKLIKE
jgi:hypothetical protein